MAERSHSLTCETCGTTMRKPSLQPGQALRCRCCHEYVMVHRTHESFQLACALGITGLFLAGLANVYPIMSFDVAGNTQSNLIVTGGISLNQQGYWPVALLVVFCAIIAPALYFASVAYVAASCSAGKVFPGVHAALRVADFTQEWSLIPVFAVACVVAVVKLDMIGTVSWHVGIVWIALLAACSLVMGKAFDEKSAARRLEELS